MALTYKRYGDFWECPTDRGTARVLGQALGVTPVACPSFGPGKYSAGFPYWRLDEATRILTARGVAVES